MNVDGELTHYSSEFSSKMRKVDYLHNCLSTGSKNRLTRYRKNLAVSHGVSKPLFDDQLIDLLSEYVYDKKDLERTLNYLNSLKDDKGRLFSRNLKVYSESEDAMIRFTDSDHAPFRWNEHYQKSLQELKDEVSRFKLKPLVYHSDDDVRLNLPKTDTHSGYYYIISGKKQKGDNMEGIFKAYQIEKERALIEGTFNEPILIAFRTQASGEFNDDGTTTNTCKHKLRVVSMISLISLINELRFSKPFQEAIQSKMWYTGGKDEKAINAIITNWRSKYKYYLSIDYSSYDQTQSSWLIEDVASVMKCAFQFDNDEDEKLFDIMVHDVIHKDFIVSEGVVHSDKGLPSGLMDTNLWDTIAGILIAKTFLSAKRIKGEMMGCGDDNIIFISDQVNLDELATYIHKNFGMDVNADKSSCGKTSEDPEFLSRYWTVHGPWRHPHQLISRMAFPERFREYNNEVTPAHVLYAYLLTYPRGMLELINVSAFVSRYSFIRNSVLNKVDHRYLPGILAYQREYISAN